MKRRPAGASVLEATVALTLVGLVLGGAATALRGSLRAQARITRRGFLLSSARNLLEAELAAPCAGLVPCPSGMRCSLVRRWRAHTASGELYELRAEVGERDADAGSTAEPIRIGVFTRRRSPCSISGAPP